MIIIFLSLYSFCVQVIGKVRSTLTDLKLAIDGTIIMSENSRDALDCMYDARIQLHGKR